MLATCISITGMRSSYKFASVPYLSCASEFLVNVPLYVVLTVVIFIVHLEHPVKKRFGWCNAADTDFVFVFSLHKLARRYNRSSIHLICISLNFSFDSSLQTSSRCWLDIGISSVFPFIASLLIADHVVCCPARCSFRWFCCNALTTGRHV